MSITASTARLGASFAGHHRDGLVSLGAGFRKSRDIAERDARYRLARERRRAGLPEISDGLLLRVVRGQISIADAERMQREAKERLAANLAAFRERFAER